MSHTRRCYLGQHRINIRTNFTFSASTVLVRNELTGQKLVVSVIKAILKLAHHYRDDAVYLLPNRH